MLSNYKPESEWSEVNRRGGQRTRADFARNVQLLAACLEYSRESEGAFDISVGPLMKVWGFYKGTGHLPHRAEVWRRPDQVGYRHVQLDAAGADGQVRPAGRGTGPRRHRQRLCRGPHGGRAEEKGRHASLWWRGRAAAFTGWARRPTSRAAGASRFAIPKNHARASPKSFSRTVHVHFRQLREVFPRRRQDLQPHHGPAHRISGAGQLSVSVITPRTIDSEAWAKPYFVNGRQWAAQHKPKEFRVYFCEDRTEQPCAWLQ